jgi:hypothetical protein
MTAIAGDFLVDALPAADAYLLMEVLHDWADDECVALLAAIRRAARVDATVLVVERVLSDDRPDPRTGTLDVVMLAITGGRDRTSAELGTLFQRTGFVLQRVIPTAGPMRIVEARAAAAAGQHDQVEVADGDRRIGLGGAHGGGVAGMRVDHHHLDRGPELRCAGSEPGSDRGAGPASTCPNRA